MNDLPKNHADTITLPSVESHRQVDAKKQAEHVDDSSNQSPSETIHEERTLPETTPIGGSPRLLVLDGLRALAICLVMVHHYGQNMVKVGFGDRVFYKVANSSWIGVDLFFILSGFLITGILHDAKGSKSYFTTFYLRRSLRIFPIYYLLLFVLFVILPGLQLNILDGFTLAHGHWFWLYGSNYLTVLKGWPDIPVVHLWSLAIEEHFYLIWPVIVFFTSKRLLLLGGTVFVILAMFLRYQAAENGTSPAALYVLTHFRIDSLVMGGLLLLAWRTPSLKPMLTRHAGKAGIALIILAAVGLTNSLGLDWRYWSPVQQGAGFTVIALFFVAVHIVCLGLPASSIFYRLLSCPPALMIGRLSYGMYLFHRPIEAVAIKLGLHPANHVSESFPSWPYVMAYSLGNAIVTVLVAWLSWNLFEKHVMRLKDRFTYAKAGPSSKSA